MVVRNHDGPEKHVFPYAYPSYVVLITVLSRNSFRTKPQELFTTLLHMRQLFVFDRPIEWLPLNFVASLRDVSGGRACQQHILFVLLRAHHAERLIVTPSLYCFGLCTRVYSKMVHTAVVLYRHIYTTPRDCAASVCGFQTHNNK